VIAWNGKEEILILSTDLHASQETKVLEVIPMPGEPFILKVGKPPVARDPTAKAAGNKVASAE